MIKKLVSVLIVFILVLSCASGLCDSGDSATDFETTFTTEVIDTDPSKTLNSSRSRAVLAVCLLLDLGIHAEKDFVSDNLSNLVQKNDSYFASDGKYFAVTMCTDGKILSMFYDPQNKQAAYHIKDSTLPVSSLEEVMQKTAESRSYHYKLDKTELLEVMKLLVESINQ